MRIFKNQFKDILLTLLELEEKYTTKENKILPLDQWSESDRIKYTMLKKLIKPDPDKSKSMAREVI